MGELPTPVGGGDTPFYDMLVGLGLLKILMLTRVKRELELVPTVELHRDSSAAHAILTPSSTSLTNTICTNHTTL